MRGFTRSLWRAGTVVAGTVAAVGTTAVLANAVISGDSSGIDTGPGPDLILFNGKISTMDAANTEVQAIAIRGGDVYQTGSNEAIRALTQSNTKVIDLRGRRVLPGLIDGHIHGMREGYHCWDQGVRFDLQTSRAAALQQYRDKVAQLDDGRWIWTNGGGWNINQFDDPRPFTFEELTAVAPKNPMWVAGSGFTGPRVNQAAFDLLGLTARSPGVEIVDGKITGRLTGAASAASNDAIRAQLDTLGIDGEAQCLASFIREANSRGMTAIKDAGGNRAPWSTTGSINLGLHYEEPTRELYRTQGLNLRIAYNGMANAYDGNEYNREVAVTENAEGFAGDDMLRYLGPGEDMMATMPRYEDFARYAAAKRLSVETHVGGNIDNIIAGMEAANAVYPISKLKWRIAHPNAGEPSDAQLDRAKAAGAAWVLTVLPIRNGGPGPRYRSVAQNSTHFCMGTDAMNGAPWEPFMGMWYLISGKTMLPGVAGVPPDQRLSRTEALASHTRDCGWFLDQEGRLGSLVKGYHADLIVPSADFFTVPEDQIKDLTSDLTIVGGRIVHSAGDFTGEAPPSPVASTTVGGTVPATLGLTLGSAATFPAFTPASRGSTRRRRPRP